MSKNNRINDKKNVNSYDAATTSTSGSLPRSKAVTSVPLGRDDRPNKTPKGNKVSRLVAVVESCPPSIKKGAHTKQQGGTMPSQSKYYYPIEYLHQTSFCGDYGPVITASVLIDPHFNSPIMALLKRLKGEGHNVEGCIAEIKAMRQAISDYDRIAVRAMMLRVKQRN